MRQIVGCDCGDVSAFGFTAFRGGVEVAIVAANGARVVVTCQLQVVSWWYPVSLCFVIEPILHHLKSCNERGALDDNASGVFSGVHDLSAVSCVDRGVGNKGSIDQQ